MNRLTAPASLSLTLALVLGGCVNLAPAYRQPAAPVPAAWPAAAQDAPANTGAQPASDLGWRDVFTDPSLRGAIELALANNRDLRLALLDIEKARATYRIEAADQWPTLSLSGAESASRTPAEASSTGSVLHTRTYSVGLGAAAWEIDLFGHVRNLKDAALQTYLGTEATQRSTRLTLIAEVATAWLTLAADQTQLALARDTLHSQETTFEKTRQHHALGADSGLTLAQTQTSLEGARLSAATYETQVDQDRNALELLVGAPLPDGLLPKAGEPATAPRLVAVPAGLPSSVLQRRPDVMAAEHTLQAANADIGAARATLFPSISLTASAGTASSSLDSLFKGRAWSFAPSVSLPIFDAGNARANVRVAELTRDADLASYEKAVQTAFREVADALAARATLDRRLAAQRALVDASQRALALASALHRGGADSYLDVLDAERTLIAARQALIALQLADQANRVTLFKVLGGGWRDDPAAFGATRGQGVSPRA